VDVGEVAHLDELARHLAPGRARRTAGYTGRSRLADSAPTVVIEITGRGEAILRRLALNSLTELRTDGSALASALTQLIRGRKSTR
jgi:hypothetical protein